jgi:DNA-3-methyladenine glycosylase II
LQAIVGQQISTKAAASVWLRVVDLLSENITAEQLMSHSREEIQSCGLSWRKVDYAIGLSEAVSSQQLNFAELALATDEEAVKMISSLKGFGPWSAEIYLMFAEGREDICPADDLAIQVAWQQLKNFPERPKAKELRAALEEWAPYRSAGCLFLWHLYGSATFDNQT